jgi:hypothetical protein
MDISPSSLVAVAAVLALKDTNAPETAKRNRRKLHLLKIEL